MCVLCVCDRMFRDFPAKNNVYTPYIYGSGQPYVFPFSDRILGLAKTAHTEILRIQIRRITISVYDNCLPYPYPYDRTWVLADSIYTLYERS